MVMVIQSEMRFHSDSIRHIRLTEPEFPWEIAMIVSGQKYLSKMMDSFLRFACERVSKGYCETDFL